MGQVCPILRHPDGIFFRANCQWQSLLGIGRTTMFSLLPFPHYAREIKSAVSRSPMIEEFSLEMPRRLSRKYSVEESILRPQGIKSFSFSLSFSLRTLSYYIATEIISFTRRDSECFSIRIILSDTSSRGYRDRGNIERRTLALFRSFTG